MMKLFSILLATSILCACTDKKESVYKVENVNGVPRITIDGTPVRARMLYVSPTYFVPVHPDAPSISSEWEVRNIDIPKPTENLNDLLLHIKPDIIPTKYWISQFEIVEKGTYFSIKTKDVVRRNDKLFKIVPSDELQK